MKFGGIGVPELIIILIVVLLIFGPKNLPKLGSALGKTVKNLSTGEPVTLYAQWRPNSYTIKYYTSYGTGTMPTQSATYDQPVTLRDNAFTRVGHVFAGWNTRADGSGTSYTDGQTVENLAASGTAYLYAQWTPDSYEIEFDPNGGEGSMEPQTVPYGVSADLTPNAFTRTGYTFVKWNTAADGSGVSCPSTKPVKNLATGGTVTLYAQWRPNNYSIRFNPNGGKGTMTAQKLIYDETAVLNAGIFTRSGYTFAGWNTAADGSGVSYDDAQQVKNLTDSGYIILYAQWEKD